MLGEYQEHLISQQITWQVVSYYCIIYIVPLNWEGKCLKYRLYQDLSGCLPWYKFVTVNWGSTDFKNQHPNDAFTSCFSQTLSESEDSPYSPDASWLHSKFSKGIGTFAHIFSKW